jgi:hypothetical protein
MHHHENGTQGAFFVFVVEHQACEILAPHIDPLAFFDKV